MRGGVELHGFRWVFGEEPVALGAGRDVNEGLSRTIVGGLAVSGAALVFAYGAYTRPGFFTNQVYLGGLVLFELILASVWMYRRVFFPVVVIAFLFAGVSLPVGGFWTTARWVFLGIGALVGFCIILKERGRLFGSFHLVACCTVMAALLSAAASYHATEALLKVLSLFLLFLYAATGARLAVIRRENRFFGGMIMACEIFVAVDAVLYLAGHEALGHPNSLGAVMGVICAPILLWGVLTSTERTVRHRRWVLFAVCMALTLESHARAGLVAALFCCGLMCLALRRYRLVLGGLVIILMLTATAEIFQPEYLSSLTFSVVYKTTDHDKGILASRVSPWSAAYDTFSAHPWIGMGLGTTSDSRTSVDRLLVASNAATVENGSSYLSILSGVGLVGGIPCVLLLIMLLNRIYRTVNWMLATGNAFHPAIPLAMVVLAALIHAGFEDWMFAVGSYLSVMFWSLAFILVDVAPARVSLFAPGVSSWPQPRPGRSVAAGGLAS
jgi:O-antigen ligase